MGAMASQITSFTLVYPTVYSDADQRKHQGSTSLAFVLGIHRGPVNSPHKGPVTRKMFPFGDVIMRLNIQVLAEDHFKSCLYWVHLLFVFLFALTTNYELNNHAVNQTSTKSHRIAWLEIFTSMLCFRNICHCAFCSVPKLNRKLPS